MSKFKSWLLILIGLASFSSPLIAASKCEIGKLADLPVTMEGMSPIITASINGTQGRFILDSGSFFSLLSLQAANELNLHLRSLEGRLELSGIGGDTHGYVTEAKEFNIASVPVKNIQFLVGGNDLGSNLFGLVGENVLRVSDIEFDFASGVLRFMQNKHCDKSGLAYWAAGKPYSVIPIEYVNDQQPMIRSSVYVNGQKLEVIFDTGATSTLTRKAAERIGIKMDSPQVQPAGTAFGEGHRLVKTWLAPVDSFKIGDEEIQHTRLRIGDFSLFNADMLVGVDFFLSHHIYVDRPNHRLFLTYNGGPVFNLTSHPSTAPATAAADSPAPADSPPGSGSSADTGEPRKPAEGELPDAAAYAGRGSAYASRRDFDHALADFNRACELEPSNPQYLFKRAELQLWTHHRDAAIKDLDAALAAKPDYVPALMARAEAHYAAGETAAAIEQLDAADRVAPPQDAAHYRLGHLYAETRSYPQAIHQFDLYIIAHDSDIHLADALRSRCWAQLMTNDLTKALNDCNRALRLQSQLNGVLSARGMVRLRMGQYDKSASDFDAALKDHPKDPWALYGRGIDRLRTGKAAAGDADIAAAKENSKTITEDFDRLGIHP